MRNAKQGMEIDPRLMQLFKDFKLYRILVVVIIAIRAFACACRDVSIQ